MLSIYTHVWNNKFEPAFIKTIYKFVISQQAQQAVWKME